MQAHFKAHVRKTHETQSENLSLSRHIVDAMTWLGGVIATVKHHVVDAMLRLARVGPNDVV